MLEHTPPRREPRVLLLRRSRGSIVWAAVDPFEVRGVGRIRSAHVVGLRLALARTVLRTHPSAIVLFASGANATHLAHALRGAARRGVPVVSPPSAVRRALRAAAPTAADLAREFPELATVRNRGLRLAAALGAAALSTLNLPPRRYVPGLSPPSSSRVGRARPRRDRAS